MPRFYFDIHDGELQRDEEGLECETVGAPPPAPAKSGIAAWLMSLFG